MPDAPNEAAAVWSLMKAGQSMSGFSDERIEELMDWLFPDDDWRGWVGVER